MLVIDDDCSLSRMRGDGIVVFYDRDRVRDDDCFDDDLSAKGRNVDDASSMIHRPTWSSCSRRQNVTTNSFFFSHKNGTRRIGVQNVIHIIITLHGYNAWRWWWEEAFVFVVR